MLNISIVLYRPQWNEEILPLLGELLQVKCLRKIYLLDNTEAEYRKAEMSKQLATLGAQFGTGKLRYLAMLENIGYGRAHNVALRESAYYQTDLHLVMNSDVRIKTEDIDAMHDWMMNHPQVGQLMPRVVGTDGAQQFLAKRLPAPIDVFGRRFLPEWMIAQRNKRYELRDKDLNKPLNVPYLSGCFMLLRTKAAVEAGLFDERYFMYPEDMDLTRTIHRNWLTLYYPAWTITHAHARASYKDNRMLKIHIWNLCLYFNKWGWFFDSERRIFNKAIDNVD